jgi:DNA-binding NarL/FixJ family response regulator
MQNKARGEKMYKKAQSAKLSAPRKVLIIEDEKISREILSKIICNYFGCEVNITASVGEAYSYADTREFDLIIIGYRGSDAIPLSAIEKIRKKFVNTRIIIVLGDCPDSDQEFLKQKGIDKIVYKPLRLSPFLEMVAGLFLENEYTLNTE